MKRFLMIIIAVAMVQVGFTQKKEWKLVWADEFNYRGMPDYKKWNYDTAGNATGWGNNEHQWYTAAKKENVFVSNGTIKITALRKEISGKEFTSARINTKNKFDFTYGKVEVRAKLPKGGGTWPAIWMLGSNIDKVDWPACGEIDIMEHLGNQPNKIYGTFHYPGHFGGNADGNTRMISNATTAFHIYAIEWSKSLLKISVDGKTIHTLENNDMVPFNHNFFIILNLAMGGNFGGDIDPKTNFAQMEIDYVRVYQKIN